MPAFTTIAPKLHDLGGGFHVRRLLPSAERQSVGPFLFFDHFGPVISRPQDSHDVRPHPHIGLATVTYLFEGAMMHRDSTGVVQRIEPGAINWMTAGRGIVHSERAPDDLRNTTRRSHGLQLWCALPQPHEEDSPGFSHTPAAQIPEYRSGRVVVRVLVGSAFGRTSPVQTMSPTLYLDVYMEAGATLVLPDLAQERAIYVVEGAAAVDGEALQPNSLAVIDPGAEVTMHAQQPTRLVVVGGAPLGHRHMVWNFVSSSRERIVQAQEDWRDQRFDKVPGETEFIPLPTPR
jgi:redox-sensitive bicupin YhaK (pirin superfamily)